MQVLGTGDAWQVLHADCEYTTGLLFLRTVAVGRPLGAPGQDMVGDRREAAALGAEGTQPPCGADMARDRKLVSPGQAEARHIGDLLEALIGARALSQLIGIALDIQYVVDDLEEEADLAGEAAVVRYALFVRATEDGAADDRGLDESACLERVQLAQLVVASRRSLHVHVLPAHHALDPGGAGHLAQGRDDRHRFAFLMLEDRSKGLGKEPVAGQDRHVFAIRDVTGRLAAAQGVVVDRRQVVVDQRIGVDQFESGCKGNTDSGGLFSRSATARVRTGLMRLPPASNE